LSPIATVSGEQNSTSNRKVDLILIGAGLANCVLAWFLRARRPELKLLIFESAFEIPKARTWSFHRTDLSADEFNLIRPLVSKEWPGYEVRFPEISRAFSSGYCSVRPEDLEKRMIEMFGADLRFGTPVEKFDSQSVRLANGEEFSATSVIDGRGLNAFANQPIGYQKFFGLHARFKGPHGLTQPILMDATVEQRDGYRFIYVLPWSESEALIEDTYYSNSAKLDLESSEFSIREYAAAHGWQIETVLSRESGALPIPLHAMEFGERVGSVPRVGVSGGFFHPVTGYSLPDSVRVADRLTQVATPTSASVLTALKNYFDSRSADWKYLCLLNRLMFEAAKPNERYRVLQHFYRLSDSLVANFYRGSLTVTDRVRILSGKPPVPMAAALKCIWSSGL
jgi:lycopene beta-cyclase